MNKLKKLSKPVFLSQYLVFYVVAVSVAYIVSVVLNSIVYDTTIADRIKNNFITDLLPYLVSTVFVVYFVFRRSKRNEKKHHNLKNQNLNDN